MEFIFSFYNLIYIDIRVCITLKTEEGVSDRGMATVTQFVFSFISPLAEFFQTTVTVKVISVLQQIVVHFPIIIHFLDFLYLFLSH